MAMASSRNETASFSSAFASSSNFTLTTSSSSSSFTYHSPSPPPSPPPPNSSAAKGNSSINHTKKHHRNSNNDAVTSSQKRSCMCSPTTHPGSFRCAYHRRLIMEQQQNQTASVRHSSNGTSNRLNLERSAMQNSLDKIEGEILKNPLNILISSPSHQPHRRETFQPRLTRFSVRSKGQDS
ncbi:hypothetical protein Lal_00010270 [Lupinus albus]|uniref:Uncharacterized protein n=1 Tax=Lupinus albus TaxID=3870 RepID=A0A6A4N6I4_LUPAL|nr:hypothetical protein Lalb_Chr24g0395391 [Lupinus albus]KAF1859686.1 hypothetical protein Lal_00010270 [Lupinus albus]